MSADSDIHTADKITQPSIRLANKMASLDYHRRRRTLATISVVDIIEQTQTRRKGERETIWAHIWLQKRIHLGAWNMIKKEMKEETISK